MKKAAYTLAIALMFCLSIFPTQSARAAEDVPQAVLELRKSVVRVVCQGTEGTVFGSGFAIGIEEPVSYIVTNLHVVEKNPQDITILRSKSMVIRANVSVEIPNADLCVLKLDEPLYDVPPVALFDEALPEVGHAVFTLGFPGAADVLSDAVSGNYEDVTITDGIIGSVRSMTLAESGSPVRMLQMNAAINPGNSGGPLVNDKGEVLGINSLTVVDSQNINGAVSILELIDSLRARGIGYRSAGSEKGGGIPVWAIVAAVGIAAVLSFVLIFILVMGRKRAKKEPALTLYEFMNQSGNRLAYDSAVTVLSPLLAELADMHSQGKTHSDICPENIIVSGARAALLPADAQASKTVILRPGYSSPEHYRADGRIGPWSDVYSVGAVFAFMLTGRKPEGVIERQAGAAVNIGDGGIEQQQGSALLAALALDPASRPQNAAELMNALGLDKPAVSMQNEIAGGAKPLAPRKRTGYRVLFGALVFLFLVVLVGACCFLYMDDQYNRAVACIENHDYEGGIVHLKHVLRFYEDSKQLTQYATAAREMQENSFDHARALFKELGSYRNSKEMIKEVDYQEAWDFLYHEGFSRAKEMFTQLAGYKDADDMVFESDYRFALLLLKDNEFDKAKEVFKSISHYKDSKTMLLETDYQKSLFFFDHEEYQKACGLLNSLANIKYKDSKELLLEAKYEWGLKLINQHNYVESIIKMNEINPYKDSQYYIDTASGFIYLDAIDLYKSGSYDDAYKKFTLIQTYQNSPAYLSLIQAHRTTVYSEYSTTKALYNTIRSFGSFEDSADLINSTNFLLYRVEGIWYSEKDDMAIRFYHDGTYWEIVMVTDNSKYSLNFSDGRLSAKNNIIYIDGNKEFLSIRILSGNSLSVRLLSELTYTMKKIVQ